MQARTHRNVAYFDRAVRQLRTYLGYLERDAARVPASVSGLRGQDFAWQDAAQARAGPQTRSRVMAGINLLAVLVAAMVTFVVGGIW